MKVFKFYKDPDTRWYVDLPEWTGTKAELEMVAGADAMLEYMAEGDNKVNLYISTEHFENSDVLIKIKNTPDIGGALYLLKTFRGIEYNLEMWLCGVIEFVFNEIPKNLYISKVE